MRARKSYKERAAASAQNLACATYGDYYEGAARGWIAGYRAAMRDAANASQPETVHLRGPGAWLATRSG
jgi:hypothetical protein